MPRNVNLEQLVVVYISAQAEEIVQRTVDHLFIPRDRRRGYDDGVAWYNPNRTEFVSRHAHQRRGRLPLAARAYQCHLPVGKVRSLIDGYQTPIRHIQVTQFLRHLHVVDHAAAHHCYMASVTQGGLANLLHAGDVRGKSCHYHASLSIGENAVEILLDRALRHGITRCLCVSAVRHQQQDTSSAQFRQLGKVGADAIHGAMVELEIPRMDDHSHRSANRQPHAIRYAMTYAKKLNPEGIKREDILGTDRVNLSIPNTVLSKLHFNQPSSQRCGVERGLHFLQQVWQSTDMIQMTMSDDDGTHAIFALDYVT